MEESLALASKEPEEENGPIPEYVITSSNEIKVQFVAWN